MSKTITRKYIQRITKREGDTSIRRNSGGGGGGGGVSQYWVDDNYVSKEFFNRVFAILDANGDAIEPNDTETVIDKVSLPSDMAVGGDMSVTGEVRVSTGVLSNGYVTALSDIRKKNVIEDIELDVNAIALARLIRFTLKDGHDQIEHVGGIAQEWQKILPEAVHEAADGTLSMDYGAIGMISAVTLARKVVRMESEVESLKKEIEELKRLIKP
jgi:hypothetical protein